ncbi:MAG: HAD family hydrolase [Actinomycetota bacterium]|nr:HAD family hydrolase [Actinomycetota bacterium]
MGTPRSTDAPPQSGAPTRLGPVQLVGIDGDDTLWRCQDLFDAAVQELGQLLAGSAEPAAVADALHERETENLSLFGYGAKGFTLSAIETVLEVGARAVDGTVVRAVLGIGRRLIEHPVEVLPGADDALAAIARTHPVVLVTKGDLVDQERKLAESGLGRHLAHVEIVSEKSTGTYSDLLRTLGCPPEEFLMVGNSERSDVEPVLEIGGWAVHVPYRTTWRRELVEAPSVSHPRRRAAPTLADVPALIAPLSTRGPERP